MAAPISKEDKEIQKELDEEFIDTEHDPLSNDYEDDVDRMFGDKRKGHSGGARKGAGKPKGLKGGGRPKGSKDVASIKRKLKEYTTNKEFKAMLERLKRWAKTDKKIAVWYAEMILGKPRQNNGLDGGSENKPIMISKILDELE